MFFRKNPGFPFNETGKDTPLTISDGSIENPSRGIASQEE
jgi:hypothetical protein